jgi:2'-5' RNA ligase
MSPFIAIDVAILLPAPARQRAIEISASLPPNDFQGLKLGARHIPHITLVQQFVAAAELSPVFDAVDEVLWKQQPVTLHVQGGGRGSNSVWMTIERTPVLVQLHERLLDALLPFQRANGGPFAFFDDDARERDVSWVANYRRESSFEAFTPHITLGHAAQPPDVEPFAFAANLVAACHLGRFCTCRRVLREWTLESTVEP